MIEYTIVNEHGTPVQIQGFSEEHQPTLEPGFTAIPGRCPPNTYWDGEGWVSKGQSPSQVFTWDEVNKTWIDPRSLAEVKALKWEEIKAARSAAIDADMNTPWGEIQCRVEDRQNITDAVMLAQTLAAAGQPVAITWTMADNSVAVFDLQSIVAVGLLLGQKVQAAHATAREFRAAIEAADTIAEVEAITWTA